MKDYLASLKDSEGKAKLTDEEIQGILAKNGEIVKNETTKTSQTKQEEIQGYKDTIAKLNKIVEESPKSEDLDALKKELQDYKDKEVQRIADEKKANEERIRNERVNEFFKDVKFASESAKAGAIALFNQKDFKYDEDSKKFQGASEWLEELKKNDVGAFESDVANPKFSTNVSNPTSNSSLDSILDAMGLKDEEK